MKTNDTHDIAAVLRGYGDCYSGGDVDDTAREWITCGITGPDEVGGWCLARVWEPNVAVALRDAGITPQRLCDIAARMTDGLDDDERSARWTDGCPIYAACNGDLDVDVLVTESQSR